MGLDTDGPSRALAIAMCRAADELKGVDVMALHVAPLCPWCRYFVIVTGFNTPQLDGIVKSIRSAAQAHGLEAKWPSERGVWIVLDFGDVIAHVMTPSARARYDLEGADISRNFLIFHYNTRSMGCSVIGGDRLTCKAVTLSSTLASGLRDDP